MASAPQSPSKSQVNKAGRVLRRVTQGQEGVLEGFEAAVQTLLAFRAAHQYPMVKANNGLRSMLKTEGCRVDVSQRLKRAPTILDKLLREPTMQLGNMQDIGGCRAVVADLDELRRIESRLGKNRPPVAVYDYVASPRESGYRGLHIVIEYDGRKIEVQLRTPSMHDWAITVERLGGRIHHDLKSGKGPSPLLDFLGAVSEAMALEERGDTVDDRALSRIADLRVLAEPWIGKTK